MTRPLGHWATQSFGPRAWPRPGKSTSALCESASGPGPAKQPLLPFPKPRGRVASLPATWPLIRGEGAEQPQRPARRPRRPLGWGRAAPTSRTRLSRSARVRLTATTCAPAECSAWTVLRPMPAGSAAQRGRHSPACRPALPSLPARAPATPAPRPTLSRPGDQRPAAREPQLHVGADCLPRGGPATASPGGAGRANRGTASRRGQGHSNRSPLRRADWPEGVDAAGLSNCWALTRLQIGLAAPDSLVFPCQGAIIITKNRCGG